MLRGQCTLSRLVGKRRRLDISPTVSCMDAAPNESMREGGDDPAYLLPIARLTAENLSLSSSSTESRKENHPLGWVKCPVCERDILEENGLLNAHLDLCLVEQSKGGKSNKMMSSQFGSVRMPVEHKRLSLKNARQRISKSNSSGKAAEGMLSIVSMLSSRLIDKEKNAGQANSVEIRGECQPKPNSFLGSNSKFMHNITETEASQNEKKDLFVYHECNCPCHYIGDGHKLNEEIRSLNTCQDLDKEAVGLCEKPCNSAGLVVSQREDQDREVLTLETVIVGRKFHRHAKVDKDMEINALREPENPKDGNAIKIVGPDNQGNVTLGHLPRNLASLLSGLLDKEHLKIEGCIVEVPERAFEPVPIKLLCEKTPRVEEDDSKSFEETWKRILEVGQIVNQRQESFNQHPSKYVHNFCYLLKSVLERESHLFDEKELGFLGSFFSLTKGAQCLFVRLSQRKGPWFRVSQINYVEISDVEQASNELLASGFFSAGDSIEDDVCFEKALRERMHVLNVPELKQILTMVNFKNKRVDSCTPKRDDLLDWIVSAAKEKHQNLGAENGSNEAAVVILILKLIGSCVRVSDTASFLLWRLQRLFFLNGEQDTSSFLLVDMGAVKYPSYVCSQTGKAFVNRDALLAYEQALEVAQAMDMAVESNDLNSIELFLNRACMQLSSNETRLVAVEDCGLKDAFLARFSAPWVFATVITVGVSVLERERRYADAIKLLKQLLDQSCCPGRRGYWTVRLSMDFEHLGYKEESLEVAEAGLNDSRIRHGDRVALQRRVLRLGKPPRRWKKPLFARALAQTCKEVTITGRPLNCQTGMKSRFYGYDDDQCSVEELALQYYAGDAGGGWQGVHSESGIWMTLFALLMWDVLFAEIPNVFWHPFQTAPLDLSTDAFYPGRETMIEAQLKRIQCGEAPQLLATSWSKWFGTYCKGLNWERHSLQELQVMASCVGGCGLTSICRLLAEDYAGLAGGMPDLFLWRVPNTTVPCGLCSGHCASACVGEAKLVEVKGPRDRLSEHQRAWISILMEVGIHVEVCKVREQPKRKYL